MDSGNSGSLQSSSGGDEEYDDSSRTAGANAMFIPHQLPPPSDFDPFSTYTQNPTMNLNRNTTSSWQRSYSDSIIQHHNQSLLTSTSGGLITPPPFQQAGVGSANPNPVAVAVAVSRNPKKRSRASRRAPTTVLTTDTTNFRAMVQEFTGIPAPPFSNSSTPFPRATVARFDHRFSGTRSAAPNFLRRHLNQKVQSPAPPFLSASSSLLTSTAVANSPTTANNNNNSASSSTPLVNYQLPLHQNSNFFNTQFPFLQTDSKFLFPTSKTPNIAQVSSFDFPPADQFDDGGGNLMGLQNLISRDQNAVDWRNNGIVRDESEGFQTSSFAGMIPGLLSFHSEKGPENVAAMRGDGTLDPWTLSSD